MYIFPDYFSENAVTQIIEHGKKSNFVVYRVGKYGKDMSISFLNYYDEIVLGLKTVMRKEQYLRQCEKDIDRLSVSCYQNKEDITYYFEITLKEDYPDRILLKGITNSNCGLSQLTSERKKDRQDSHVDWWLFKNATPWLSFKEVDL